jgi:SnoaL-like domain
MTRTITEEQVRTWVGGYLKAWSTCDRGDIGALFTENADSHEWPYETAWVGRQQIIEGWQARAQWQEGGWSFDWSLLAVNGDTFAVKGTGVYAKLGTFDNLWVVTLDDTGGCAMFRMWNNEA